MNKEDPFHALFEVYYGVGGRPEAILIPATQDSCDYGSTTLNRLGDRSEEFLTCWQNLTASGPSVGLVGSNILFHYKFVAEHNFNDLDAALQTIVLALELTNIFYEDGAPVKFSISWMMNVNFICNCVKVGCLFFPTP